MIIAIAIAELMKKNKTTIFNSYWLQENSTKFSLCNKIKMWFKKKPINYANFSFKVTMQ